MTEKTTPETLKDAENKAFEANNARIAIWQTAEKAPKAERAATWQAVVDAIDLEIAAWRVFQQRLQA
jgi:hypothetical protein